MGSSGEALTSERLAEIRERVEAAYLPQMFGWQTRLDAAILDSMALLSEVERLRAALAAALPFLRELAKAHTSMLDDDDVIIKVSPGRAAWVISRAKTLLASTDGQGEA